MIIASNFQLNAFRFYALWLGVLLGNSNLLTLARIDKSTDLSLLHNEFVKSPTLFTDICPATILFAFFLSALVLFLDNRGYFGIYLFVFIHHFSSNAATAMPRQSHPSLTKTGANIQIYSCCPSKYRQKI
jgi:hypothetical protein